MSCCLISAGVIVAVISVVIAIVTRKKHPEKIFGVYSQPGTWYYLKYYLFLALLYVRSAVTKLKSDDELGAKAQRYVDDLDTWKPLSSETKAFDAVFFQAVDNAKGYYLCGGVERRHGSKINGVFYILVPGIGLLRSEHLPKTSLDASKNCKENGYEGGGIHLSMLEAMKKWKVAYNGKMWLDSEDNKYDVTLDADWTSNYPHFMFDTGMDKGLIAEAIARETWTRELFDNLKSAHQVHYEQMGILKGTLKVNGVVLKLEMASFRDHSFGTKRDWTLMHRYAFHMMYLEDNTRICVGVVSQPCTTSHLAMGYLVTPKKIIHPIVACNLLLHEHGESGRPGKDIAFSFEANNHRYDCTVRTLQECEHFKGDDIEARLIERFTTCEVNGVRGRGIAEWQYNNMNTYKSAE